MLSDVPRQQLAAIFVLSGKVADDDKLCEAFLRDYCGEYRREIAALSAAVRWGVPKSLREGLQMPPATLRANLARRLEENQGLDPENAFWAVDAWASVVRPASSPWPAGSPAVLPSTVPMAPVSPTGAPAAEGHVLDWSHHSPPPAASPVLSPGLSPRYSPPAAAAGVLSPPASVPDWPQPAVFPDVHPDVHPVVHPVVHPIAQPIPGIPFSAAASAFLAGVKSPDLKVVQGYLKQQLKIRKPASLLAEIQAAGVAPGIAKGMVNRVRRNKALIGLLLAVLLVMAGFMLLGTGLDAQGEITGRGTLGFFVFVGGSCYALWSVIRIVRFS